jgi:hypothetical protein
MLLEESPGDHCRPARHHGDRAPAIVRFAQRGQGAPSGAGDDVAPDIGRRSGITKHTRVHDERVHPGLVKPIPDERVLAALRVKGPDEKHDRHRRSLRLI